MSFRMFTWRRGSVKEEELVELADAIAESTEMFPWKACDNGEVIVMTCGGDLELHLSVRPLFGVQTLVGDMIDGWNAARELQGDQSRIDAFQAGLNLAVAKADSRNCPS